MSAFFSSIKTIVDNYNHGIDTIQAQIEDMKFGLMSTSSSSSSTNVAITISNTLYTSPSTTTTTPNSSTFSSRKNSYNNNNNNNNSNSNNNNNNNPIDMSIPTLNATSDFNQWLHAMKMVARLQGGTPPEFRRKLWLALADRHLHNSGIDWNKEQTKCLSEACRRDDDEELGIQIVKDLHRTGSSFISGPNGQVNQAKLKRILLGYARWNPEVGYCQGFNMLGALILQVMERSEIESLKVMIYLIEGILPQGYFCGSLSGLQADMAVFREILANRLPKLSKHLHRLQKTIGDNTLEPPIINVFTMQWFLTLFCTCLPKSCVLRVWDLILIEGSDILLRTALAIWASISERILAIRSADEFYCKMGAISGELLNGHLFDSNGLIQRIVDLGPINDLDKMREKHRLNAEQWKDRKGLKIFYSDEDVDSDDERATRKAPSRHHIPDTRERIAIDISLLKKQYIKLRERQRQANISNVSKQPKQPQITSTSTTTPAATSNTKSSNINQYLIGRNAIVSSKGKRIGPPAGAIPPARLAAPLSASNKHRDKRLRNATIATVDNASTSALLKLRADDNLNVPQKSSTLVRKRSESSSYSEDSEKGSDDDLNCRVRLDSSSSDTSLCDEECSMEATSMKSRAPSSASDDSERQSYVRLEDPEIDALKFLSRKPSEEADSQSTDIDNGNNETGKPAAAADSSKDDKRDLDLLDLPNRSLITSTSQLSPIADISNYLGSSSISPLKTPTSYLLNSYPMCELNTKNVDDVVDVAESKKQSKQSKEFQVSDEGVTNAYFERVNHVTTIDEDIPSLLFDDTILNAPSGSKSMELIRESRNESPSDLSDSDNKYSDPARSPSAMTRKNNDLILKIIEENSRILDRIMMKNTQSSIVSSASAKDKGRKECDIQLQQSTPSDATTSVKNTDEKVRSPTDAVTYPNIIISSDPSEETLEVEEILVITPKEECISLNKFESEAGSDEQIFKYGDLSECISKYLTNSIENTGNSSENTIKQNDPIETPPKSADEKSIEPETPSTLALLVTDHDNPDDLKNLLKQSFFEYSKSPSESLPIDSKLENDLETLLKMSAELLRDEYSVKISTPEPLTTDPLIPSLENPSIDMTTSTQSNESSEAIQSNRSSAFFDADALQIEMESVAGDISATISSIKNTIKSIDSLCQDDDRRSRERTDKTLDDIIKVVAKLDEEREDRSRSRERHTETSPYRPMATSSHHEARTEPANQCDSQPANVETSRYLASSRVSRDRSRISSISRRKDDDFGEYESRARRNKSPSTDEYRKDQDSDQSKSNYKTTMGSTSSSPYKIGGKLEMRHTTVTSTFYDRFLSQKFEERFRMDRSPSSPVINRAYLNTLKPTPSKSFKSDHQNRPSKSNETSPENVASSVASKSRPKSTYVQLPQFPMSAISRDTCTRSCDNILSDLNEKSSLDEVTSSKYATPGASSRTADESIDRILKRHSTGVYYQSTSALQTKPKKPSELGIKLGMYKPS